MALRIVSPCMPVIPRTWRLRQEDHKSEVCLGNLVKIYLKKKVVGGTGDVTQWKGIPSTLNAEAVDL